MSVRKNRPHRLDSRRDWVAKLPIGVCPELGKKMFVSRADAKRTARSFNNGQHPYSCEHCGYWHLGHQGNHDRQWHRELHGMPTMAQEA